MGFLPSGSTYLWFAGNGGMDPCNSPYITHDNNFHLLFHSFITSQPRVRAGHHPQLSGLRGLEPTGTASFRLHYERLKKLTLSPTP